MLYLQLREQRLLHTGLLVHIFIEMKFSFIGVKIGAREGLPLAQAAQLLRRGVEI